LTIAESRISPTAYVRPGWDVRILDEDEQEVPRGERG
jgi:hypothetical protein